MGKKKQRNAIKFYLFAKEKVSRSFSTFVDMSVEYPRYSWILWIFVGIVDMLRKLREEYFSPLVIHVETLKYGQSSKHFHHLKLTFR